MALLALKTRGGHMIFFTPAGHRPEMLLCVATSFCRCGSGYSEGLSEEPVVSFQPQLHVLICCVIGDSCGFHVHEKECPKPNPSSRWRNHGPAT